MSKQGFRKEVSGMNENEFVLSTDFLKWLLVTSSFSHCGALFLGVHPAQPDVYAQHSKQLMNFFLFMRLNAEGVTREIKQ